MEQIAEELSDLYDSEEKMIEKMEREIDEAMAETGLGNRNPAEKSLGKLSCGWRYKTMLVASILLHPDMIISDEPSFLDQRSTGWLVRSLRSMAMSDRCIVILISHKEALLDATCDKIVHINSASWALTTYPCGYEEFRSRQENELTTASRVVDDKEARMEKAARQLKNLQKKMQLSAKNTKTKYSCMGSKGCVGKVTKTSTSNSGSIRSDKCQKADKAAASRMRQNQQKIDDLTGFRDRIKRERVKPLEIDGTLTSDATVLN